eukprot:CAMPEP_0170553626 /NCGR_PEP_ID=MMETSP0211-20121228/11468_1 /TAXON_ID=311385 /ORGANISM="Pseudokeronopsis sp., Strain OXSARD2" /LENGTH=248 /DNA_ID=CAMNT_0010862093 /DNA_START=718 /DNA_END=1464 /DNA_ORIENTATION=-
MNVELAIQHLEHLGELLFVIFDHGSQLDLPDELVHFFHPNHLHLEVSQLPDLSSVVDVEVVPHIHVDTIELRGNHLQFWILKDLGHICWLLEDLHPRKHGFVPRDVSIVLLQLQTHVMVFRFGQFLFLKVFLLVLFFDPEAVFLHLLVCLDRYLRVWLFFLLFIFLLFIFLLLFLIVEGAPSIPNDLLVLSVGALEGLGVNLHKVPAFKQTEYNDDLHALLVNVLEEDFLQQVVVEGFGGRDPILLQE